VVSSFQTDFEGAALLQPLLSVLCSLLLPLLSLEGATLLQSLLTLLWCLLSTSLSIQNTTSLQTLPRS
jgi:hypothetical protein